MSEHGTSLSDTISIARIVADVPDYIRVRVVSDGREMTVDVKPVHFALALTGAGPMPCIVSHRDISGLSAHAPTSEE